MESQESIMEEREELMAAAGGGEPIFKRAHFLAPTQSHLHQLAAFPRSSNTSTMSSPNVVFLGWRAPQNGWGKWVHQLEPVYGQVWKRAGIYDAVLASTYNVVKNRGRNNLMLELAEKWCPKTNTFLFPWGECTVTLEDVMILGGFPVLGELVFRPCGSDEMIRLEKKLSEELLIIRRNTGQPAREGTWLDHFVGGGSEKLEHEAFLVLWLTRFVFPTHSLLVEKGLFLIAINLSRGIRIAFGPAVLASIYRDLSCLKKASLKGSSEHKKLTLCSPLEIVQVWAWERFPRLSPIPNPIEPGEPRLARWSGVSSLVWDVAEVLDSSGEDFQWRPYARILRNWDFKDLYNVGEGYIMAGSEVDCEAVQVLVRCWRNSELVGMDCVEQYLPHRVGMQFGFDQDLPGLVERLNDDNPDKAWSHYNRPVKDLRIYVPARLSESKVTKRYQEKWTMAQENPASEDVETGICGIVNEVDEIREENANETEELASNENVSVQVQMDAADQPERMEICDEDPLTPPGFGPKTGDSSDQDRLEADSSNRNENVSFELWMEFGTPAGVDHSVNGGSTHCDLSLASGSSETQSLCDFNEEPSGNAEMVICGNANEVDEIREKNANEMEELMPNDKLDADIGEEDHIIPPCFGPKTRDPSDENGSVELRVELGTPVVIGDIGLRNDQTQLGISEAVGEAALDQAVGNGKGSSRSYTIEEVTAMVVNLEKHWAAVKAKRRESATTN